MLRSPDGVGFGFGDHAEKPFWVTIKVVNLPSVSADVVYNFTVNYCAAGWQTNQGGLICPSMGDDFTNGSIYRSLAPKLENGETDNDAALVMVPAKGGDGFVEGAFSGLTIKDGYHFRSVLGCQGGSSKCQVTYVLKYKADSGESGTLGTWDQIGSDKVMDNVVVDLSSLAGKRITLYLVVNSKGDNTDDRALWLLPRITKN
jgi:hypothetical protein